MRCSSAPSLGWRNVHLKMSLQLCQRRMANSGWEGAGGHRGDTSGGQLPEVDAGLGQGEGYVRNQSQVVLSAVSCTSWAKISVQIMGFLPSLLLMVVLLVPDNNCLKSSSHFRTVLFLYSINGKCDSSPRRDIHWQFERYGECDCAIAMGTPTRYCPWHQLC